VLVPVIAGAIIALTLVLLPGVAFVRRARRRRRVRSAPEAVGVRYVEFLEWCRAASLGRLASETPVEHARRVASRQNVPAQTLDALAILATAAVYGDDGGTIAPGDAAGRADAARKVLAASVPAVRRILPMIGWGWWRSEDRAGVRGR
jgi:hypothetical protein